MKESEIFKPYELEAMQERKSGDYSDKNGVFSRKVKPKIREILDVWIPKAKELRKLLEKKKRKVD